MLKQCVEKRMPIVQGITKDMQVLSGFPVGSRWRELQPGGDVVLDPVNEFAFHAPTDDPDALPRVQKQNFDEVWDRPVFSGRDPKNNVRLKGHPRAAWIRDEGLDERSHPVEWLDAFLPVYQKSARSKSETPHHISSEQLCRWSNEKARLMQMGTKTMYPGFTVFTTEEWEQYLYIFFYNGLCPSPSAEMKLQKEETDPIQSDAFLRRCLGPNATVRFKEWKACFACQDPKVAIPSRKTHPNFKVDEYFRHLQIIFRYAWMPGRDLSGDEQTMGFKGKHADKLRITYKKEGDGFQCDCICDDGYTFTFYFRNQPAEKKWLDQGLSPLHARCMSLFDCFMDEYHQVRFDNLYMSAKFALAAFEHPKKVMVEGVTRSSQRGLPPQVVQADVQKNRIAEVKGTVKAAVLEDCPPLAACPLVAASVYDQKGVHFLSTCVQRILWIEKFREVFDKTTQRMRMGKFLRLAINDDYNNNMNNVDIADQLRGSYRPDRWMRKQKWWWSMFFWGHGTLMVNAYIAYKRFMEIKGLKPMSHYDFRKMIVLAKICPTLHGAKKQQGSIASQRGDQRSAASSSKGRSKRATETAAASTRAAKQQKMETSTYASHGRVENDNSDFNMIRLERSLHHLPEPVDNEKRGKCCALCRYATGKKLRANILRCGDCKTILCSFCYKPFHTLPSISAAKNKLCDEINERCNGKKDKAAVKKGK
jgi:ribosomal protein L37AE/L43A